MVKHIFIDAYDTLLDFTCRDRERAETLMKEPLYYRGLPLKVPNIQDYLLAIRDSAEKYGIDIKINLIASVCDENIISKANYTGGYNSYFPEVRSCTVSNVERLLPKFKFDSYIFVPETNLKSIYASCFLGSVTLQDSIFISSSGKGCTAWRKAFPDSSTYLVKNVLTDLPDALIDVNALLHIKSADPPTETPPAEKVSHLDDITKLLLMLADISTDTIFGRGVDPTKYEDLFVLRERIAKATSDTTNTNNQK